MKLFFYLSTILFLFFVTSLRTPIAKENVTINYPNQAGFPLDEANSNLDFSSPLVIDSNNNGRLELLAADLNGCVYIWDENGTPLPHSPWMTSDNCLAAPRINGVLAAGNIDGDPGLEIIAGTRAEDSINGPYGKLFAWQAEDGTLLPGWPQEMAWSGINASGRAEIYSVLLADISGDSRAEIIAGTSNNSSEGGVPEDEPPNLYAWSEDATLLPGFPIGYRTAGIYGFVGAADFYGDGKSELVVLRDHRHLQRYQSDGAPAPNFPVEIFVDQTKTDINQDLYLEFTRNAPVMADLDLNRTVEIIAVGRVRDPLQGRAVIGSALLLLNSDGTRAIGWEQLPVHGTPLDSSFLPSMAPAVADLNGDGRLEIVASFDDGYLRAYEADGTLLWAYDFAQGKKLFGSEVAIGDVTGDGIVDIVWGSYNIDSSGQGFTAVYGVSALGIPLAGFPLLLPDDLPRSQQGVRGAPTLIDLDQDGDIELIVASRGGFVYGWDMPAPYVSVNIPWPTSRYDWARTGFVPPLPVHQYLPFWSY